MGLGLLLQHLTGILDTCNAHVNVNLVTCNAHVNVNLGLRSYPKDSNRGLADTILTLKWKYISIFWKGF